MRFSQVSTRSRSESSISLPRNCHYILAASIRLWFSLFSIWLMHRTFYRFHSNSYSLLGVPFLLAMPVETYFSFRNNKFLENKYFSPSSFLFIYSALPCIWILHLNRLGARQLNTHSFADEDLLFRVENLFMLTLLVAQWLMPKLRSESDDIYALVIGSLSMSLDMHELIRTSLKPELIGELTLSVALLSVWSWSLVLLALNTDAKTRSAERERVFEGNRRSALLNTNYRVSYFQWKDQEYLPLIFENFYWKYIVTISAMDGPFFLVRMVVMFKYGINDVKHTFFLFKNLIQILLQLIRILGRIYFRMV